MRRWATYYEFVARDWLEKTRLARELLRKWMMREERL